MTFTPFDFNEAIAQRRDHANEGLRLGSPVVGFSCAAGVGLLTVRRTQRKVFEIYDRIIYSAIGNQSDIEAIRLGAVDLAAREGFERSPDDVTAQRMVGFALSPALKEVFRDQFRAPSVIRAIFGELGRAADDDAFFTLNYDGEFSRQERRAVVAGSESAEDAMREVLDSLDTQMQIEAALEIALRAWGAGMAALSPTHEPDTDVPAVAAADRASEAIREALKVGHVEVGLLDRSVSRDAKFRLLGPDALQQISLPYRSADARA